MGDKYIKKGDDGKDYLYEEMGFWGDRKIGEVKETDFISRAFGASRETVKSDNLFSNETYSVDRDDNPLGGLWGAPEHFNTNVTDDRTEQTADFEYEWRFDGERYSEQHRDNAISTLTTVGDIGAESSHAVTINEKSHSYEMTSGASALSPSKISSGSAKKNHISKGHKTDHRAMVLKKDHR